MKKTFIVTEKRPAFVYWTYEVEAETEAEAIDIVENGDAEVSDFETDIDYNESLVEFESEEN